MRFPGSESLAHSLCFPVLTCPSLCALQLVSAPPSLTFFPCPSLRTTRCAHQDVSTLRSLTFYLCHHPSLPMRSPGSECTSFVGSLCFRFLTPPPLLMRSPECEFHLSLCFNILTCPSRCALQDVSSLALSLSFCLRPDLFLTMHSPGCEFPRSPAHSPYPHLSLPIRSPVRECPSLTGSLSVTLLHPGGLSRQ